MTSLLFIFLILVSANRLLLNKTCSNILPVTFNIYCINFFDIYIYKYIYIKAINSLGGATVFNTLDMRSDYWQVGMKTEDIPKTAFSTMCVQYEWKLMPQGLSESAATFQNLVNCIMAGQQYEILIVYLGDIIAFGKDYNEHLKRLEEVLKCLQNANLKLALDKCNFLNLKVIYLGHIISQREIKSYLAKMKVIAKYPQL